MRVVVSCMAEKVDLAAEKSRVRAHSPQASRERSVVCDWRK
jgi:hypothetical protein